MKTFLLTTFMLTALPAMAVNYDCQNRGIITVKTSIFSKKVTSVNDIKIANFSDYVEAEDKFGYYKDIFSRYYDGHLVEAAYTEDYRVSGGERRETGYSRGFFELAENAYMLRIWRPSPWCMWDACRTHYEIISCTKI
jgi:hypothetical protein